MSNSEKEHKQSKVGVDTSRRRLAKAALIGAPILMTLPGKSALAGSCTSLSGMLSGNLSGDGDGGKPCDHKIDHKSGRSPGFWRTICTSGHDWPLGRHPEDKVTNFFAGTKYLQCPLALDEYSLLETFWLQSKHIQNTACTMPGLDLTRHTVAAVFNSEYYPDYFISGEQAIDIYNSIINGGAGSGYYVEPVSGEHLYYQDILNIYEASYVSNDLPMDGTSFQCGDTYYQKDTGHVFVDPDGDGTYERVCEGSTETWQSGMGG